MPTIVRDRDNNTQHLYEVLIQFVHKKIRDGKIKISTNVFLDRYLTHSKSKEINF